MGQTKKLKCIDLDYLISRTKSNPELMMQMISIYLEQTPPLISTMKQSFHDKDWNLLYSSVHKMIPSFSIMGIDRNFENMARQVQEYANSQIANNEISEFVLQLETICLQACKELEVEYNILKKTLLPLQIKVWKYLTAFKKKTQNFNGIISLLFSWIALAFRQRVMSIDIRRL